MKTPRREPGRRPLEPCVFRAGCPSRGLLAAVTDKWVALVLRALAEADPRAGCRYGELARRLDGISEKMLTQTLRELAARGIVTRRCYPVVPPMVVYTLTPGGRRLSDPVRALCRWAEENCRPAPRRRAGGL